MQIEMAVQLQILDWPGAGKTAGSDCGTGAGALMK